MFGYTRIIGNTALHWAAEDGRTRDVQKLLGKGEDVNCRNKHGDTPLHLAAFRGHVRTSKVLIANGADVNAREYIHGGTPLHETSNPEVVKLLLAAGADVNAKLNGGRTPLDCVVTSRNMFNPFRPFLGFLGIADDDACIELLREHGAKSTSAVMTNDFGTNPLMLPLIGITVCFAGYIWFLVIAFKEDIVWGFACLLIPIVSIGFLTLHWEKCKKSLVLIVAGALLCFVGAILEQAFRMSW